MNISTAHLPVQHISAAHNVRGADSPKSSVSSSIEAVKKPVVDTIFASINDSENPTYNKPTQASIYPADSEHQQVTANNINSSPRESSETDLSDTNENNSDINKNNNKQGQNEVYSEAELSQINEFKSRDTEVIAHERAHAAVGGQHTGSPSYSYKTGPDGVKYAVSGKVSIDLSSVPGDPRATLQKTQQIKAAALAPAEPSGQDRKVAAKAAQMAMQARNDILESNSDGGSKESSSSTKYNEASVPEYFTGEQSLSINNKTDESIANNDSSLQSIMNERSFHINEFYKNSANVNAASEISIHV